MKVARLSLTGHFVEAYLYFDFAWLVARDGTIRAFDIEAYCQDRLNGQGSAAAMLFADNQRLAERRTSGGDMAGVERLLGGSTIEVAATDVDHYSYIFETTMHFRSVLDVRFYYGRGYVGTDRAIQQLRARGRDDVGRSRLGRTAIEGLEEVVVSDRSCRQFQCRYGAVGAACGSAGGLIGLGATSEDPSWRIRFEEFAPRSYGVELNGDAITSLAGTAAVEVYSASTRSTRRRFDALGREEAGDGPVELTGVGEPRVEQQALIEQLIRRQGEDVTRVVLFKNTLWSISSGGRVSIVQVAERDRLRDAPQPGNSFDFPPDRVLSTSTTDAGVVIESDDRVLLMQGARAAVLFDEATYSVRGYPSSRRYKNLVTAVARDRVELIAVVK